MGTLDRGIALAALCGLLASPTAAQRGPAKADITPIVEHERIGPGTDLRAALQVRLPEGYHVNSNKPRDPSLIPIRLEFGPVEGIAVTELVFPEPSELNQRGADQPLTVFERDFVIGVVFRISPDAGGRLAVPGSLRYQTCDELMCYFPATATTEWVFEVAKGPPSPRIRADLFGAIRFGQGEVPRLAAAAPVLAPRQVLSVSAPSSRSPVAMLDAFTVRGSTAGYLGTGAFLEFIRDAEAGVRRKGMLEGRGPLAILLIVLLGGLALNLTPCVLPMIPINLAIIGAGARAGSRGRGFFLGAAYGGAMAFVYGVLGLVVILSASTFGAINASPWFNLGIAVLFVVLSLAMFDVLVIDFSRWSSRFTFGAPGRGSFTVAFAMGAVAALLAGACVAPVVVQVVLFSSNLYAGGTTMALALPFFLGVGMAVPWPIAGAGIGALPKPGAWMVRIKQVFGVAILATAAYYGYEAYALFSSRWVDPAEVSASVQEKLSSGWHASLADGLAAAERDNKPVLIDMWATWCKNCLVMDRTTLQNQEVTSALAGYVKIKLQAENPDDATTADVMRRLGAVGLPTYVILAPR
jgi:cytochrome c biogenesis protein CcdA